ncbi:MAG: hypothetical protein ACKVHE_06960 [Planctomycetales bacterium]
MTSTLFHDARHCVTPNAWHRPGGNPRRSGHASRHENDGRITVDGSGYGSTLSSVQSAFDAASQSRERFEVQTEHFVSRADELEAKLDSAVDQFADMPDKTVTWDTSLKSNWDAADGRMHVRIGLLTKLHLVS